MSVSISSQRRVVWSILSVFLGRELSESRKLEALKCEAERESDAPSAACGGEGTVTNNDLLYPSAFCSHGMKVRRKVDLLKHKQTA